jgi:hypothetical protein
MKPRKWNVVAVWWCDAGPSVVGCFAALSKFLVLGVPFAPSLAKSITCDQILLLWY